MSGRLNYVTRTTMEIQVDVYSEEGLTGVRRFTTTAFLTYVAIDQDGRPTPVPGLLIEDEETKRRFEEGGAKRSEARLAQLSRVRESHKNEI